MELASEPRGTRHPRVVAASPLLRWLSVLIATGVAGPQATERLLAQEEAVLSMAGACGKCLSIHHLAVLSSRSAPGPNSPFFIVGRAPQGYLLASEPGFAELLVFGGDGVFLRTVGQPGQGPQEFGRIRRFTSSSRGPIVVDERNLKIVQYDSTLTFVGSTPLPFVPIDLVPLGEQGYVVNAIAASRQLAGFALHHVSMTGAHLNSFAEDPQGLRSDLPYSGRRHLAARDSRTVWSARMDRYEIELWSLDGQRLDRLSRVPAWFPPARSEIMASSTVAPASALQDLAYDRQGLIWIVVWTADEGWEEGLGDADGNDVRVVNINDWLDSVVEVVDPVGRRVLASQRFDLALYGFSGDHATVSSYAEEDGVWPVVQMWRLQYDPSAQSRNFPRRR